MFELEADDGDLSSSDTVVVVVSDPSCLTLDEPLPAELGEFTGTFAPVYDEAAEGFVAMISPVARNGSAREFSPEDNPGYIEFCVDVEGAGTYELHASVFGRSFFSNSFMGHRQRPHG